tara:strand:+ start:4941 stop:6434 length:1494 start_codon:yes stop_codon:yes gene_type:complete
MATTIPQQPYYSVQPATSVVWKYTVKNDAIVSGTPTPYYNVKFVIAVFVSDDQATLSTYPTLVGTFKTVPNNVGVGMFDIQRIIEGFTKPQYEAYFDSTLPAVITEYKGQPASATYWFPIHIIDKFSRQDNQFKYIQVNGQLEGGLLPTDPATYIAGSVVSGYIKAMYNGYIPENPPQGTSDLLSFTNFGWPLAYVGLVPLGPAYYGFLSDAPLVQYANQDDYGTVCFFNDLYYSGSLPVIKMRLEYFFEGGSSIVEDVDCTDANGGVNSTGNNLGTESINYFGVFPANLRNWNTNFQGYLTQANQLTHYTYKLMSSASTEQSMTHTINVAGTYCNADIYEAPVNLKGYIPIRITWLNSAGAWDYYTFKMKSTESIKTKKNTWTELKGTWNKETWQPHSYKGGKKTFTVNSVKKIKVNTDFVDEENAAWFEKLINSPEAYVLAPYSTDISYLWIFGKYVTPVRLLSSSYIKKTRANNNIMQYTFEFEESSTLDTQPV